VKEGANIIYGDLDYEMKDSELRDGAWMSPIVTEGISFNSRSYEEEFFGPVFNLYRVASSKEILDYANKSEYGLAGTIFTEDLEKAQNYATRLRVGSVVINDVMASHSDMPSGGIKNSGFGRECYSDGVHEIAN
jgi:succinate-semialdehyde dehydrogenase / glutarate-semialdehyde dehydrogenase